MAILSYSGRGRGGGGGGRGRDGRGGSYHRGGRSFSYNGGGGGGRARGSSFNSWNDNYGNSWDDNYGGGGSNSSNSRPVASNSKWVRPKEDSANGKKVGPEGGKNKDTFHSNQQGQSKNRGKHGTNSTMNTNNKMVKKGHNQLILSKSKSVPLSFIRKNQTANSKQDDTNTEENLVEPRCDASKGTVGEAQRTKIDNNTTIDQADPGRTEGISKTNDDSQSPHDDEVKRQELSNREHSHEKNQEVSSYQPKKTEILNSGITTNDNSKTHPSMTRRGRNQLILTGNPNFQPSSLSVPSSHCLTQNSSKKDGPDEPPAVMAAAASSMRKLGSHKLILNGLQRSDSRDNDEPNKGNPWHQTPTLNMKVRSTTTNSSSEHYQYRHNNKSNNYHDAGVTRRKKWNKIVLPNHEASQYDRKPVATNLGNQAAHPREHHKQSHYETTSKGRKHNAAKRIKLTVLQQSEMQPPSNDDGNGDEQLNNAEGDATKNNGDLTLSSLKTTEKLTDFAYRETSRKRKSSWHHHQQQRNMGLVRVQPDLKTTPICPTFLRGVECTDKYCQKRHDVPKEFAIPICSFFQRRGQCLKGDDCVFRHIKVNPRALICPSFSLLGFCDDKDCSMKHVRGPLPNSKLHG